MSIPKTPFHLILQELAQLGRLPTRPSRFNGNNGREQYDETRACLLTGAGIVSTPQQAEILNAGRPPFQGAAGRDGGGPGHRVGPHSLHRRQRWAGPRRQRLHVPADRGWNQGRATHSDNFEGTQRQAAVLNQAMTVLLTDLQTKGLLSQMLVVLGNESVRTSRINDNGGRDHHNKAFTCLLAGAWIEGAQADWRTLGLACGPAGPAVDVTPGLFSILKIMR